MASAARAVDFHWKGGFVDPLSYPYPYGWDAGENWEEGVAPDYTATATNDLIFGNTPYTAVKLSNFVGRDQDNVRGLIFTEDAPAYTLSPVALDTNIPWGIYLRTSSEPGFMTNNSHSQQTVEGRLTSRTATVLTLTNPIMDGQNEIANLKVTEFMTLNADKVTINGEGFMEIGGIYGPYTTGWLQVNRGSGRTAEFSNNVDVVVAQGMACLGASAVGEFRKTGSGTLFLNGPAARIEDPAVTRPHTGNIGKDFDNVVNVGGSATGLTDMGAIRVSDVNALGYNLGADPYNERTNILGGSTSNRRLELVGSADPMNPTAWMEYVALSGRQGLNGLNPALVA